jgi:hypothetical protein
MLSKGPAVMEVAVAFTRRLGCVNQPLFTSSQPEGIWVQIRSSGAIAVIMDVLNWSKFQEQLLGNNKKVFFVNAKEAGLKDAWDHNDSISNNALLQVGHHQSWKLKVIQTMSWHWSTRLESLDCPKELCALSRHWRTFKSTWSRVLA